jgi:hypothetical protein
VGVNHSVYWISWVVVGVVFSTLSTLVLIFAGMACQFDVFFNAPFL